MSVSYRHTKILELLEDKKSIRINTLAEFLNVSNVTIRKDLDSLHGQGLLIKTHGSAVSISCDLPYTGVPNERRLHLNKVVNLAFSTIENGDCIFLGSGYTCTLLAEKIKSLDNITVVTNNINSIPILLPSKVNVFVLGGEIIENNGMISTSCYKSDEIFQNKIVINKAYTSVVGIDIKSGLTVNYERSVKMYSTISKITDDWYLMADSDKFDKKSLYKVCDISDIKCLISDNVPDSYKEYLKSNKVKILSD